MSQYLPETLAQALEQEHATFIGGGTDIMPLLKNGVRDDKNIVLLKNIPELHEISEDAEGLRIGAGVTLAEIAENALIRSRYTAVAQAAERTASPQIRNIATIGGNIMQDRRCIYFNQSEFWRGGLPCCFKAGGEVCLQIPNSPVCRAIYYSDVATALIALEAKAEYVENGRREVVALEELIARHSEANGKSCHEHLPVLVTRFLLPRAQEGEKSGFYKYAMRTTIDFPLINFALRCGGKSTRAVAGAVAPQPVVLAETAKKIAAGAGEQEIIECVDQELKKLAMPIKEACISPAIKRELYKQILMLLPLMR